MDETGTRHHTTATVVLPDGSTAVLNSGATLERPRRFAGDARAVSLRGEAFFDVEPGAVPFVVTTPHARVEVLGTAFNVRGHADEAETRVALLHGRVRVAAGGTEAVLAPGEAVVVETAPGRPATVGVPGAADVVRATAWQQGGVAFDGRPLGEVLAEIGRRYDVAFAPAAGTPLDARVSVFYAARPSLTTLLGDLGAAAGVRFAPGADGYSVRPVGRRARPAS